MRTRFGEETFGNHVKFLIDGEETFAKMYGAMDAARTCIYIANYDIDPQLRFVRRLTRLAPGTHRHEVYPLQDLLLEKAKQGVDVKIIVWEPRLVLRLIPGADERGIDGRAEQVEAISEKAKRRGLEHKLEVRIDSTAPTFTSAHHEKVIIVDNSIGFCGGLDLSKGQMG